MALPTRPGISLVILLLSLALAAAALPAAGGPAAPGLFKRGRVVLLHEGRRVTLEVEVAATPEARARGLMFRRSLPDDAGMLFIFEEEQRWAFWMRNTLIPLSIAFISRHWRIVDIQDMAVAPDPERGPFPFYEARVPARFALEVRQGLFRDLGMGVGARVIYTPYD